jgi:Zn finger protein HypA/HybF involved in hydrogenase expression
MLEGFSRIREKYRWIFVDKKVNNRVMVKIQAEVVNGKCPTCDQFTTLVGLDKAFYRCMTCGSDLEQHVNGKISYLPVMTAREDGGVPFVKEWLE